MFVNCPFSIAQLLFILIPLSQTIALAQRLNAQLLCHKIHQCFNPPDHWKLVITDKHQKSISLNQDTPRQGQMRTIYSCSSKFFKGYPN